MDSFCYDIENVNTKHRFVISFELGGAFFSLLFFKQLNFLIKDMIAVVWCHCTL